MHSKIAGEAASGHLPHNFYTLSALHPLRAKDFSYTRLIFDEADPKLLLTANYAIFLHALLFSLA